MGCAGGKKLSIYKNYLNNNFLNEKMENNKIATAFKLLRNTSKNLKC